MEMIARRQLVDWDSAYQQYGPQLSHIESVIQQYEMQYALTLTPDAVEILLLPFLIELERRGGKIEQHYVQHAVEQTFAELFIERDKRDIGTTRSVFSVIRAWWKAWCNIPPICRPTDE